MDENRPQDGNRNNYNRDRNDRGGERNDRGDRNRGRFRHHGGHRPGGGPGHGRGRPQRPLLSSATNAAGFTLLSIILLQAVAGANLAAGMRIQVSDMSFWLTLATVAFGLSALVSYVAQRVGKNFIEWISDAFFIIGMGMIVWVALGFGGML